MSDETSPGQPSSARTTVRRKANRAEYGKQQILEILREGSIAHVAVVTEDGPLVLPMAYGVTPDTIFFHGALANSILGAGSGAEICVTVTIVDGLVFAKTPFNHSMNYRSVVVRGCARAVEDSEEKFQALRLMTDHIVPTWDLMRTPSVTEMRATRVLALSLSEASAKVRTGGAVNVPLDADAPFWSGVVPVRTIFGTPVSNVDAGAPPPAVIDGLAGTDLHS